jgi:hypothetical protein
VRDDRHADDRQADDRQATEQPVQCAGCGASVRVVKFSPQHTSVQWSAAAVRCCAEFRARAAEGARSALIGGCGTLRASIDSAVTAGLVIIAPPSYGGTDDSTYLRDDPAGSARP